MQARLFPFFLLLIFIAFQSHVYAQALTFNMGSASGFPDDTVTANVTVEDFTGISGYQGTIRWDSTVLSLLELNSVASGINNIFGQPGQGLIPDDAATFTWVDFSGGSKTLTDGSVVIEAKFLIKSTAPAGVSPLTVDGSVTGLGYSDGSSFLTPVVNQGTVTVTVCTSTADPSFTYPNSICQNVANNPLPTLSGDPGGIYSVDNGATINPTTGELDLSTTLAGTTYLVTYTVGNPCAAFESESIQILAADDASFTYPDSICVDGLDPSATLTGLPGGTFSVDLGAGINASTGSLDLSTTLPGTTYTISYTTSGSCPNVESQTIYVSPVDDASFTMADTVCINGANPSAVLTGLAGGTFSVDLGASIDAVSGELDLSTLNAGSTYTVSYQTAGSCPNLSSQSIFVRDTGDASFTYPAEVCPGGSNPLASITGTLGGTFSVLPSANINATTGELDLSSTTNGQTYTITYSLGGDCPTSSDQQIVVQDITAPDSVMLPEIYGACFATVPVPATTDNCAGQITGTTNDPLVYVTQGTFTVNWTFDDGNGNVLTLPQSVVVQDTVAPFAICQDVTIQLNSSGLAVLSPLQVDNGSFDNCALQNVGVSQGLFTIADLGIVPVLFVATDVNGNADTCMFNVTVVDQASPLAVCVDLTVALDSQGIAVIQPADLDGGSTVFSGTPILSVSQDSFDCASVGPNGVTLYVMDTNGRVDSCTATVTVRDTLAPMIQAQSATVYLDGNGLGSLTAAEVDAGTMDVCALANVALGQTEFDCEDLGTNQISFIATDVNGNRSSSSAAANVTSDCSSLP